MNNGIIQLAENLIDDIGKCRVRLRSARRSVSVPRNKNSTTTSTTINEDNEEENENQNEDNEGNSNTNNAMKRTDLEEETIANVSAMLDMSANEVEEVLGMSSSSTSSVSPNARRRTNNSTNNSRTPPHHRHPLGKGLPSGTTPMRGVRAQHTMALAQVRLALQNDPVDVNTVFEVLHGLIVERAKVEGALIKIHQQFVLERTESKIKKAENRLARQINHEQQGRGKRTTVSNQFHLHHPSSSTTNHIGRESSPPTIVSTRTTGRTVEAAEQAALNQAAAKVLASQSLTVLASNVPSNVAVLVGEIKLQMEKEHDAAQLEIMQFRSRVQDLERQLKMSENTSNQSQTNHRTKRTRSGAPTGTSILTTAATAATATTTAMVVSEFLNENEEDDEEKGEGDTERQLEEQLRPLKRAALEQRLQELQRDAVVVNEDGNSGRRGGVGSTPERAQGIPVPFGMGDGEGGEEGGEFAVVESNSGKDKRTSARRGTYYGLCK